MKFINCSEVLFKKSECTIGYDFSVENNETFLTKNGLCLKNTAAMYKMHDHDSLNEIEKNAFIKNLIRYDHMDNMIHNITSEASYFYSIMITCKPEYSIIDYEIDHMVELPESDELYDNYQKVVKINNIEGRCLFPYGIVLINKWLEFEKILVDEQVPFSKLSEIIFENSKDNEDYHRRLKKINNNLVLLATISSDFALTTPVNEIFEFVKTFGDDPLLAKLMPHPYIGNYIYSMIVDRDFESIPENYKLYYMILSKLKKISFKRSLVAIGYIANDSNIIDSNPIKNTLLKGLDEETFFKTTHGGRLGLVDKEKVVPKSGELERNMTMGLSPIEISEDDCGTTNYFKIHISSLKHAQSLKNRYFLNKKTGKLELFNQSKYEKYIGKKLNFRSPITCESKNYKICNKCFGEYNIGKYVGLLAGSHITERLTQISMSSFHSSGSMTLETNKDVLNFFRNELLDINLFEEDKQFEVIFKNNIPENILDILISFPGYISNNDNIIKYNYIYDVENGNITQNIKKIKDLLRPENSDRNNKIRSIKEIYDGYIEQLINISNIYSSFIEVVLCNMFYTKDDILYRYALNDGIEPELVKKYGIRTIQSKISPLLGLVFSPNKKTIDKYQNTIEVFEDVDSKDLSIFEKLYKGIPLGK